MPPRLPADDSIRGKTMCQRPRRGRVTPARTCPSSRNDMGAGLIPSGNQGTDPSELFRSRRSVTFPIAPILAILVGANLVFALFVLRDLANPSRWRSQGSPLQDHRVPSPIVWQGRPRVPASHAVSTWSAWSTWSIQSARSARSARPTQSTRSTRSTRSIPSMQSTRSILCTRRTDHGYPS